MLNDKFKQREPIASQEMTNREVQGEHTSSSDRSQAFFFFKQFANKIVQNRTKSSVFYC